MKSRLSRARVSDRLREILKHPQARRELMDFIIARPAYGQQSGIGHKAIGLDGKTYTVTSVDALQLPYARKAKAG